MKTPTTPAASETRPSALFHGEILERYLLVERRIASQQSVASELPPLLEALEQQLEQLSRHAEGNPTLHAARALMKRVTFEILQHWAKKAELGSALSTALGKTAGAQRAEPASTCELGQPTKQLLPP